MMYGYRVIITGGRQWDDRLGFVVAVHAVSVGMFYPTKPKFKQYMLEIAVGDVVSTHLTTPFHRSLPTMRFFNSAIP